MPGSLVSCDNRTVLLADKSSVKNNMCGAVVLPVDNANVRLRRALYILKLVYNLFSTDRLANHGIRSLLRREHVQFNLESVSFVVGHGKRDTNMSGLYTLPEPKMKEN